MFVRIRKNKRSKRRSVIICHNIRFGDRIRQIIVKTLGHSVDDSQLNSWVVEARCWIKAYGANWLQEIFPMRRQRQTMNRAVSLYNIEEQCRINVGVEDIFGKLYNELGFHDLLSPLHQKTLKQVLFARILEPGSKRRLSDISDVLMKSCQLIAFTA